MGRFYQTDKGEFIDGMYQLPYEQADQLIGIKDLQADSIMKEAIVLQDRLDKIQHLDFEADNERVKQLQDYYQKSIDDMTNLVQSNVSNYGEHLPRLREAKRQAEKDATSGLWSSIENRRQAVADWQEANKDMKASNPNQYAIAQQYFLKDLTNRASEDPYASFSGEKIQKAPDINTDKFQTMLQGLKPDEQAYFNPDGTMKTELSGVDRGRATQIIVNALQGDPGYMPYLQQQNMFGNKQAQQDVVVRDEKGNAVLDSEGVPILNPNSLFYNQLQSLMGVASYKQVDQIQTQKYLEDIKFKNQYKLVHAKGEVVNEILEPSSRRAIAIQAKYTEDEIKSNLDSFMNLFDPNVKTDPRETARLEAMFSQFTVDDPDVLKAASNLMGYKYNPNMSANENRKVIAGAFSEMMKMESDNSYGITTAGNSSNARSRNRIVDRTKRNRIKAFKELFEDKKGNVVDFLHENTYISKTGLIVDPSREEDLENLKVIQAAIDNGNITYLDPNLTTLDINGNLRGNANFEQGYDNSLNPFKSDSKNPLQRFMTDAGIKDMTELSKYGTLLTTDIPADGEAIFVFTPNSDKLKKEGKDIGEFEDQSNTVHNSIKFKVTGLDETFLENLKATDNSAVNSIILNNNSSNKGDNVRATEALSKQQALKLKNPEVYWKSVNGTFPIELQSLPNSRVTVKEYTNDMDENKDIEDQENKIVYKVIATNPISNEQEVMTVTNKDLQEVGLDAETSKAVVLSEIITNESRFRKLDSESGRQIEQSKKSNIRRDSDLYNPLMFNMNNDPNANLVEGFSNYLLKQPR